MTTEIGPDVTEILPQHRFDETRLGAYLHKQLPDFPERFTLGQFGGGHSNPTFLLDAGDEKLVLRKKPPGALLRGAHQVEREFRVMKALKGHVPVPVMRILCEDESVVGTPFFLMDYVAGRLSAEPHLPELVRHERRPASLALARNLARLHSVDWREVGLGDFGKPENYLARQIRTWSRQFETSKTAEMPAMDRLISSLADHVPEDGPSSIVHGDYRPGNMIFASDCPEIVAILDWELSTIGHPLADLGYVCMPYHLPAGVPGIKGLAGLDLAAAGLATESEFLDVYTRERGLAEVPDLPYFVAFSLFRLAAILQGVYARALQGNASRADANEVGDRAGFLAERGWEIAARL